MRQIIRNSALILSIALGLSTIAQAEVQGESIAYKEGKTILEGYMAHEGKITGSRPAVLIIHQWMGLTDYEKMRAQMLADKGYIVFAVDIYGKGVRPTGMEEAGKLAGEYKGNTKLFRKRIIAGLDVLKAYKNVDPKKIVVMGYCFGGTGAIELARSGTKVAGIVSFHGGLPSNAADAKKIKEPMLILHGADDNFVNKEVPQFKKELDDAKVDYEFISYPGAVHAFTQKMAGDDPSKGMAYNEKADQASWLALMDFLNKVAPMSGVKK